MGGSHGRVSRGVFGQSCGVTWIASVSGTVSADFVVIVLLLSLDAAVGCTTTT